jgi:arsenate reductase
MLARKKKVLFVCVHNSARSVIAEAILNQLCGLASGQTFDCAVTVCDETSAERCPVFPGSTKRLHMGFPDPSSLSGTPEEKLESTRRIPDQIKAHMESEFCARECPVT